MHKVLSRVFGSELKNLLGLNYLIERRGYFCPTQKLIVPKNLPSLIRKKPF